MLNNKFSWSVFSTINFLGTTISISIALCRDKMKLLSNRKDGFWFNKLMRMINEVRGWVAQRQTELNNQNKSREEVVLKGRFNKDCLFGLFDQCTDLKWLKFGFFFAKPFSLIIIIYLEDLGILEAKFLSEVEKLVLSNCCGWILQDFLKKTLSILLKYETTLQNNYRHEQCTWCAKIC